MNIFFKVAYVFFKIGILTVGGNGELLTNVIVQNAPTTEQEFLVVKVKSV